MRIPSSSVATVLQSRRKSSAIAISSIRQRRRFVSSFSPPSSSSSRTASSSPSSSSCLSTASSSWSWSSWSSLSSSSRTTRAYSSDPTTATTSPYGSGNSVPYRRPPPRQNWRSYSFSRQEQGQHDVTAARYFSGGGGESGGPREKNEETTTRRHQPAVQRRLCWLDLRGSGLSVLERLLLEECLLRHDDDDERDGGGRHWVIAGYHENDSHRFLTSVPTPKYMSSGVGGENKNDGYGYEYESGYNGRATIVMGIGGKPTELLDLDLVRREPCWILKRFSGGGTVVVDYDSVWTTIIGRTGLLPDDMRVFPREIMDWTAESIFRPVFDGLSHRQNEDAIGGASSSSANRRNRKEQDTLVMDVKSCGVEFTGRVVTIPRRRDDKDDRQVGGDGTTFRLRENDYVMGERKMGGNAQSIVKQGWLHHTSFLWDYSPENMRYLTLPKKRPDYRRDRDHDDFLVGLRRTYPNLKKRDFVEVLGDVCERLVAGGGGDVVFERMTLRDAMKIVDRRGGMQAWYENGARTKVVVDLPRTP